MKNPLQAHSAKSYNYYKSEFQLAERACKDKTQRHQVSFKGSFAAWNPEAVNEPNNSRHLPSILIAHIFVKDGHFIFPIL